MEPRPLDRRPRPWLAAGALVLGACGGSDGAPDPAGSPGAAPRRPVDIVLIVIDTLRADALFDPAGAYDTPHLDRLAREGVPFPQAFSAAPMTLPAHVSLFSSRAVHETGVRTNGVDVPADLPLLAEWLAAHGYDTRAVLSLGTLDPLHPERSPGRGFASYDHEYLHLAPAEASLERLRASLAGRDAEKPLFLFAHFADPHEPYEAHGSQSHEVEVTMGGAALVRLQAADMQQWRGRAALGPGRTEFVLRAAEKGLRFLVRQFECLDQDRRLAVEWLEGQKMRGLRAARLVVDRGAAPGASCELRIWVTDLPKARESRRRYALEVAHADRAVGALLAELERLGLYRDGLVLFTSDHGEGLGEHDVFGHVENLSDALIRVPLILKLPAGDPREPALRASAAGLVSHLDLVPTVLEVAGLPPLPGQRGSSLFAPGERLHVAQTSRPEARTDQLALRDARFKMVYFPEEERFELYDLGADPEELRDVFAERAHERPAWPARLRELRGAGARAPAAMEELDEAEQRRREELLEALGYAGEED